MGLEKLSAILKNVPVATIDIVAPFIREEIYDLALTQDRIRLHQRPYRDSDLDGKQLVFLATDQPDLHYDIKNKTRARNILTNVADTPHLCDFYLGSVISKGQLKIGISTNGKSPTVAKRLREYFEWILPDDVWKKPELFEGVSQQIKKHFKERLLSLAK